MLGVRLGVGAPGMSLVRRSFRTRRLTSRRAQAPGFSRGVERVTEWYDESSMRSMAPAPGLRGRSASSGMEPTSQLLCGGTGSGASGQSGSA